MAAQKYTGNSSLSKWDRLRIILALGRAGSLSAAARTLGVDHTTIARHLDSLEHDLGAPLFERGPEGFTATPLGQETVTAAERMEAEVLGLLRRLDGTADTLTGLIRLTATPFFCAHLLAPMLKAFLEEHPGLQVELIGDSRHLDLSRREADVAVRLSRPETPGLVARPLGKLAVAWYAAANDSRPFERQRFLGYDDASGHDTLRVYFDKLVPSKRVVMRANMTQTLLEAARSGLGCAILPCVAGERDPALRRVVSPQDMAPMTLWLVYHEDLRRSPRLRAAVQLIDAMIAANRSALGPQFRAPSPREKHRKPKRR